MLKKTKQIEFRDLQTTIADKSFEDCQQILLDALRLFVEPHKKKKALHLVLKDIKESDFTYYFSSYSPNQLYFDFKSTPYSQKYFSVSLEKKDIPSLLAAIEQKQINIDDSKNSDRVYSSRYALNEVINNTLKYEYTIEVTSKKIDNLILELQDAVRDLQEIKIRVQNAKF